MKYDTKIDSISYKNVIGVLCGAAYRYRALVIVAECLCGAVRCGDTLQRVLLIPKNLMIMCSAPV